MFLNAVYHGRNRKQCYYRAGCLVCFVYLFAKIMWCSGGRWRSLDRKVAKKS